VAKQAARSGVGVARAPAKPEIADVANIDSRVSRFTGTAENVHASSDLVDPGVSRQTALKDAAVSTDLELGDALTAGFKKSGRGRHTRIA
jgi:hypothetical protein